MGSEVVVNVEVAVWVAPFIRFAASALRFAVDFTNRFGIKIGCTDPGKLKGSYVVETGGVEVTLTGEREWE